MTEPTMKKRFINWLKELWGEEDILMRKEPSAKLKFGLREKKE